MPKKGYKQTEEHARKNREMHKGKNNYWYGKNLSGDHKRKIGEAHKGFKHSEESKKKNRIAHLGRKQSEEAKRKISEAQRGENNSMYGKHHKLETIQGYKKPKSEETRRKMSQARTGKKISEETIRKIKKAMMGRKYTEESLKKRTETRKKNGWFKNPIEAIKNISIAKRNKKNPSWIDGRSRLLAPGIYGDDWDKIRYLVYLRDRFTCQHCGIQGKRLDIHHKVPFLVSFDNSLNNLITLCRPCHAREDSRIRRELKNKQESTENNKYPSFILK